MGPNLQLVHPLLWCPKTRLEATCAARGAEFVRDRSNESPTYDRNRVRHALRSKEGTGEGVDSLAGARVAGFLGAINEDMDARGA